MTGKSAKLLFVITDLKLGGVPLHLQRLATAMRQRGYDCEIAALGECAEVASMLRNDGFAVHSCEADGGWDWRVFNRLISIMRSVRPDIVHAMLFHANIACRAVLEHCGLSARQLICEIQTVERERPWHLWVDRWTHTGARLTVGNSPSVIEHLALAARIPRDRLRLVPGGVDPEPLRIATAVSRESVGLPEGVPLVGWVGRLDPVKGLDLLIEAFVSVAGQTSAHLVLVGEGPLHEALQDQAMRLSLGDRVHLVGPRQDIPSWLAAFDVFAFPSMTEGLPNALLEAMATGLPVVTTNVAGCRDLVFNGETGLLVPFGDVKALAQALSRLIQDRPVAQKFGHQASQFIDRHWHIDRTFQGYERLYIELLADHGLEQGNS